MKNKMLLSIILVTITSSLVFAGEPGRPLGKSPNHLDITIFVKQPGGAPLKQPNNPSAKHSEYKKK